MSENTHPEQNRPEPGMPSEIPPGYDQPARPAYGAPSYQQPAPPTASAYQEPGAPASPYPGAPQPNPYQANPYQGAPQANPYQANSYPPNSYSGQQQNLGQGYPQPGFGYAGGEQKSKVVAGILGILLGSLGIHNFYLGKTKIALVQLLVSVVSFGFLAPVMGVWGLVEGILILVGHESYRTDSRGIPLKD